MREGGEVLQVVELDQGCFSCVLGGEDRRTLYVATNAWGDEESAAQARPRGQVVSARVR